MKSRRPRPTLFPYTTLFRSRERGALLRGDRDATQLAPLDLRQRVGEVGEGEADLPAEHVGDRLRQPLVRHVDEFDLAHRAQHRLRDLRAGGAITGGELAGVVS